jgi:predicted Ser/Thr protein kinase
VPEGALYTFEWTLPAGLETIAGGQSTFRCPMHEEPLHLIPPDWRSRALIEMGINAPGQEKVRVDGDLDPACRMIFRELMAHYKGDWSQLVQHVRVRRLVLSEQDRVGIGTFQPKDEKNQDSTELTGDINYRKIAEFGSDSDPRAFNFDGEFNIANRGIIEFIEVLKILFQMTNFGEPFIAVEDANHANRGELLLAHRHEGADLHQDHACATLEALARIWRRPVNLRTLIHDKPRLLRYDGSAHSDEPG